MAGKLTRCASMPRPRISCPVAKPEKTVCRPFVVAASLAASLTIPLSAQGWIDVERRPNIQLPASPVLRISSQVRVQVDGRVARVEVEEQFRNNGGGIAEG